MQAEQTLPRFSPADFGHLSGLKRLMMETLAKVEHGQLHVLLDGNTYVLGKTDEYHADIHLKKFLPFALRGLTRGDLGFAESYIAGELETGNLRNLLLLMLRNREKIGRRFNGNRWLRLGSHLYHKMRRNSLRNSRENISRHYDMGNDFYCEWLDPGMTYSSALYTSPGMTLEQAQDAKYQRILDELQAKPGDNILEIGCGWGGFAEAAATAGYNVHGITLSTEQLAWARQRLSKFGGQTRMELRDYRHLTETYDHIVSIEMFEAVGEEYWQTYFDILQRSLKPGGRAVLQIITIGDEWFEAYRSRPDFIQRYIFPGGMLPSPTRLQQLIGATGLRQINHLGFGQDYARTLAEWDQRFIKASPKLRPLGYDQRFGRLWRYYLAYCEAGFTEQRIDVVQLTLEKPHS